MDTAFLAQALIRAPNALWYSLNGTDQRAIVDAIGLSRDIPPDLNSNWVLFPAMIEVMRAKYGFDWREKTVSDALQTLDQWSQGDGFYGDGPYFRASYYNSFVILPMLLDILSTLVKIDAKWSDMDQRVVYRAQRHSEVLERLMAIDGSYPPIGRSLTYRCAILHPLGQLALHDLLPKSLPANQVRCCMEAVIQKTLSGRKNYTGNGWLTVGLNGAQPDLAENYVSVGSLYLCATAFMPLGLPSSHLFWSRPKTPFSQQSIWGGKGTIRRDRAIPLSKE